jgi:hypothetical protein
MILMPLPLALLVLLATSAVAQTAASHDRDPGSFSRCPCGNCGGEIFLRQSVFCVPEFSLTTCHSKNVLRHLGLVQQVCMKLWYQGTRSHPTAKRRSDVSYVPHRGDTRIYRLAARGCT